MWALDIRLGWKIDELLKFLCQAAIQINFWKKILLPVTCGWVGWQCAVVILRVGMSWWAAVQIQKAGNKVPNAKLNLGNNFKGSSGSSLNCSPNNLKLCLPPKTDISDGFVSNVSQSHKHCQTNLRIFNLGFSMLLLKLAWDGTTALSTLIELFNITFTNTWKRWQSLLKDGVCASG